MHGRTTKQWLLGAVTLVGTLSACTVQNQIATTSRTQSPPSAMPWVDMSKVPAPGRSLDGPAIISVVGGLKNDPDSVGAFRTYCAQSHMLADDPIVAPGQPGAAHLHTFFGNTGAGASSTASPPRTP